MRATEVTLLIPGLLGPVEGGLPAVNMLPKLAGRLARSTFQSGGAGYLQQLFSAFALPSTRAATLPVAAASYRFDHSEREIDSGEYLLRADPVHLRAEFAGLLLYDNRLLALSDAEAEALCKSLNHHYRDEELRFEPGRDGRCYLCLPHAPGLETTPLDEVVGRDINRQLPRGADAPRWHRLLNELQMVLHTHPVNTARELAGRPTINSLWLWGGGHPPVPQPRLDGLCGNCAIARGLARLAAVPDRPLPASVEAWLEQLNGGRHLLVIDALQGAITYGDGERWWALLQAIESAWLRPLIERLDAGELDSIELNSCGMGRFTLRRGDRWRLWRRNRPFESWLQRAGGEHGG